MGFQIRENKGSKEDKNSSNSIKGNRGPFWEGEKFVVSVRSCLKKGIENKLKISAVLYNTKR